MFLQAFVILSTGGEGCLPQCMLGYHHPPGTRTSWEQTPPLGSRRQHTINERPVCILLECILVFFIFPVFLPPANEVWGKVIFLHQFVILFTGGGGHVWLLLGCVCGFIREGVWFYSGGMRDFIRGVCMVLFGGGVCVVLFRGHAWFYSGACMVLFGGACVVFSVFLDTMRYGQ